MTALPGSILEESRADPSTREKSFELAGRFTNSLHSSGIELPSMPASQRFTDEQLDLYLLEVEPHIDGPTLRWIDTIIRRSDAWEGLKIVPIQGDFSPRHWLANEGTAPLGVIDWEISRPGYFVEDFQRMMQDHWLNEPQLRDGFFTGYGRTPSDREWLQANQVLLIHAIRSVPWAIDHGDLEYERFNRVVIERLKKVL